MEEAFNPFSLRGKTILVTGASSGIGKGIAITCSKMGATLILNGRDKGRLERSLSELAPGSHQILPADLTMTEDILSLTEKLPPLDGIVHCAGIGQRKLCKQLEVEDVVTLMNSNFTGPILLQTEILKKKKLNREASIVFLSSMAVDAPSVGNALYSASKAALLSYANCLAIELAPRKIRVNTICPAMIWTNLILKGGLTEEQLREDEQRYPLKRYGQPDDIANLAVYLLSDASSWMTGSKIKITGGALT